MFEGQSEGFSGAASALAPGLVLSSTSHTVGFPDRLFTPPSGALAIDAEAARLKRMRAGVMTWARVCTEHCGSSGRRWRALFVTLTYADSGSWAPKQISSFLMTVSAWARRSGFAIPYVWTMELQKRGAPHYHLILWVPHGVYLPKPDQRRWWVHGSTNVVPVKGAAAPYIAKYVSKGPDASGTRHELPKGSRVFGKGGLPRASLAARVARWWAQPAWTRENAPLSALTLASGLARRVSAAFRKAWQSSDPCPSFISEAGELLFSPWRSSWCPVRRQLFVWRVAA